MWLVMRSVDVFFDVILNKLLRNKTKQSNCLCFQTTLSWCYITAMYQVNPYEYKPQQPYAVAQIISQHVDPDNIDRRMFS